MRKTLFALSLIVLTVSTAFSMSISDWKASSWGGGSSAFTEALQNYTEDYGVNGFKVNVPQDPEIPEIPDVPEVRAVKGLTSSSEDFSADACFSTGSVNWLYNPNMPIFVRINGFVNLVEDSEPSIPVIPDQPVVKSLKALSENEDASVRYLNLYLAADNDENDYAEYNVVWTGNGVYKLTPEDLIDSSISEETNISYAEFLFHTGNYNVMQVVPLTYGTVEIMTEYSEVPEPATYAYGVMGLISVFGLRRRIKK